MATIAQQHKEIVKDYERLKELVGVSENTDCEDFCGGFCNTEKYNELLINPSLKLAVKMYKDLFIHTFQVGFEGCNIPDIKSHEIYELYKKHVK